MNTIQCNLLCSLPWMSFVRLKREKEKRGKMIMDFVVRGFTVRHGQLIIPFLEYERTD